MRVHILCVWWWWCWIENFLWKIFTIFIEFSEFSHSHPSPLLHHCFKFVDFMLEFFLYFVVFFSFLISLPPSNTLWIESISSSVVSCISIGTENKLGEKSFSEIDFNLPLQCFTTLSQVSMVWRDEK
jgi:hypothetical protein